MSDMGIGRLIYGDGHGRDAIHVAVAPVVAAEGLKAGQHVGLTADGKATKASKTTIGIVDPFLREPAYKGARFWLFLYPGTITSLRHQWAHPAFGDAPQQTESRQWIEEFAVELDQTYKRLMEAADLWVDCEDYTYDNSETYKKVAAEKWPLFWHHYEIVTGRKVKDHRYHFFTCSC